jgi:RNA polymerase sigma-70 factor (family 1)
MNYAALPDHELAALLKAGDNAAFTEIYRRYWKLLYQTALNITREEDLARDVTQDVFIDLWRRRATNDIAALKAYLQQAARYAVFKLLRQERASAAFYHELAAVTTEIIADDPLLFKEQQALLAALLQTLPEAHRETFRLSREEYLTYKQIAARLGISEKAVEKRLSKALKLLRAGLNAELCIAVIGLMAERK